MENKQSDQDSKDRFAWEEESMIMYDSVEDMLRDQAKQYEDAEYIAPGKRPKKLK